ncbi:MAG: Tol-Pal system beta propeller repeat protein TolB [Aestuariivita sp.]|nr:Tol-Pal system beta propeller repeat protein TolB [Aestuariivita sp.]
MRVSFFFAIATLLPLQLINVSAALAQSSPLRIEITQGVIEPLPFAIPNFIAENTVSNEYPQNISRVIANDLTGTGLFREIPETAFISQVRDFSASVQFADWKAINAQALITGTVAISGDNLVVQFRLFDVFANSELGQGLQFTGPISTWRRMAHKVADSVYSRITGEGGYFDSRIVFVSETGAKGQRQKRLAIMDYDGENVSYLTDAETLVLVPRFSPDGDRILYTSYATGNPRIHELYLNSSQSRVLEQSTGTMSFSPRFAPDGQTVIYSLEQGGNTDIYSLNLDNGEVRRLTSGPSIDTAPSFSPDGSRIVFESDRSGGQQLYVMSVTGEQVQRISFGEGRYGTPVWSPRGDLIAFSKQNRGRFHIGVMRVDGSEERLLTASFLDESPTWAPNGRVIMFARETRGELGRFSLYTVDISGRNLKQVLTPAGASDPSWSALQK